MQTIDLATTSDYLEPILKGLHTFVANLPAFILFILVGVLLIRITVRITRFIVSLTAMHAGLRTIIPSILEIILWTLFLIQALTFMGFQNVIVFFSSSVLAIGLLLSAGGSTIISDIVAGLFLARDEDFSVGDEVIAGETPTRGIVEQMDARRIRLRDGDGVLHVIPNSVVERKEWVLIKKQEDISPLLRAVKTAKRLGRTALEKRTVVAEKKEFINRKISLRKNDQSNT